LQAKGIHNIFNKIITKFSKSIETYAHTGARSLQNTNRPDKNRTTGWHIIIKKKVQRLKKEY
jgi:hypothetical protein